MTTKREIPDATCLSILQSHGVATTAMDDKQVMTRLISALRDAYNLGVNRDVMTVKYDDTTGKSK